MATLSHPVGDGGSDGARNANQSAEQGDGRGRHLDVRVTGTSGIRAHAAAHGGNRDCEGDCEAIFTALLAAADALGIANDMVIMPDTVHIDLISEELVPAISAIVAPFLHQQALDGVAQ